jgi:hypothetical protein
MILRANLEATLDLVAPEDLSHSQLLTVAVMTHPPDGKPVLSGPTHPAYRAFQAWVTSLVDPNSPNVAQAPQPTALRDDVRRASQQGEAFASGRTGTPAPAPGAAAPLDDTKGAPVGGTPKMRRGMSGAGNASAPGVPGDVSFPDPRVPAPMADATPAAPREAPATPTAPREAPATQPAAASGRPEIVQKPDGTSEIRLPDGRVLPYIKSKDLRPDASSKDSADKPKINTKVLDRYLQERNAAKK